MIEPEGPLSLSRQCVLLEPVVALLPAEGGARGESDAADGRAPHGLSVLREPADDAASPPQGVTAGRHRIRRLMAVMGMEATYRRPRTSVANSEHRIFPYLLRDLEISRTDQYGARTSPISQ